MYLEVVGAQAVVDKLARRSDSVGQASGSLSQRLAQLSK